MCTPHAHTAPGPSSPRHAPTLPNLRPKILHFSCPDLAQPCLAAPRRILPCRRPKKTFAFLMPAPLLSRPDLALPRRTATHRASGQKKCCTPRAQAPPNLASPCSAPPRRSGPSLRPKEKAPLSGSLNHKPLAPSRQENCPSLTANRPKRGRHSQSPI